MPNMNGGQGSIRSLSLTQSYPDSPPPLFCIKSGEPGAGFFISRGMPGKVISIDQKAVFNHFCRFSFMRSQLSRKINI
jgi:hypothetical protein